MNSPSHVYSGLFHRDQSNLLNLVICNQGDFAIHPGCIEYKNADVDNVADKLQFLLTPQTETEFHDALDAIFGDHKVYNELVPSMPQRSGSCYLQAGILLIKALGKLLQLGDVTKPLIIMEVECLVKGLFKKYPEGSLHYDNMMAVVAKCILHQQHTFSNCMNIRSWSLTSAKCFSLAYSQKSRH